MTVHHIMLLILHSISIIPSHQITIAQHQNDVRAFIIIIISKTFY